MTIKYDLIERYWIDSPKAFGQRMKEIVDLHPSEIETFELCKNSLGQSVPGFRMGIGPRNVFLSGREHGHEPVGTCGLTALIEGLAKAKIPGSNRRFPPAEKILKHFTLHIFPLMNPDGAERFSRQVKNSFPAAQFSYSQKDTERYRVILSEPGITLGKGRPPHFSNEDLEVWRKTGKPIGSLYTEDGVELWLDWEYEKAPQTRALKRLMYESRPYLFVDIHAHEGLTTLMVPAELDDEEMSLHKHFGSLVYNSLRKASIPFDPKRQIVTFQKAGWSGLTSVHWVYENFHAIQFLYEVDNGYRWYSPSLRSGNVKLPAISKVQIIMAVLRGITALLKIMSH